MRKGIAVVLLCAFIALLAACSEGIDNTPATIRFSDGAIAKSVTSPISMDTAYYEIMMTPETGDSSITFIVSKEELNAREQTVTPGKWSIKAIAYNENPSISGIAIGEGSTDITVGAGETATAIITIKEYDGIGKLNIIIAADTVQAPSLHATISGSRLPEDITLALSANGEGIYTGNTDLPNGYYSVSIYNGDKLIDASSVRIIKNQTSTMKGSLSLNPDGSGFFEIIDAISKDPVITFSPTIEEEPMTVPQNGTVIMNASAANVSDTAGFYWVLITANETIHIDGTSLSLDLTEYTLPIGNRYRISFFVEDGGVVWAEGFTIMITDPIELPETIAFSVSGITDGKAVYGNTVTLSATDAAEGNLSWFINGEDTGKDGTSFNYTIDTLGDIKITAVLEKDGAQREYEAVAFAAEPFIELQIDNSNELYFPGTITGTLTVRPELQDAEYHLSSDAGNRERIEPGIFSLQNNFDANTKGLYAVMLYQDQEYRSGTVNVTIKEADFNIIVYTADVMQGQSFNANIQWKEYIEKPESKDIKWFLDGVEIQSEPYSDTLSVPSVDWAIGEHTLYAEVDGVESPTITINVIANPGFSLSVDKGQDDNEARIALESEGNADESEIDIEWDIYPRCPYRNDGKTAIIVERDPSVHYSIYARVTYKGADIQLSANLEKLTFASQIASVTKGVFSTSEQIEMNLNIQEYLDEGYNALLSVYNTADVSSMTKEEITVSGTHYINLASAVPGCYGYELRLDRNDSYPLTQGGVFYVVGEDSILNTSIGDVYLNISISDNGEASLAAMRTLILGENTNAFLLCSLSFTDRDGGAEPMAMEYKAGSYSIAGNVLTLDYSTEGENDICTINGNILIVDGNEYVLQNSSRSYPNAEGTWRFATINPPNSVAEALFNRYLKSYTDEIFPTYKDKNLIRFDEGEGIDSSISFQLAGGEFTAFASVGIDLTAFDGNISFADGFSAQGLFKVPYRTSNLFDGSMAVTIDDFPSLPLVLQSSADNSVLIAHIVLGPEGETIPIPFTRTDSFDIPRGTGRISKTASLKNAIDMAKEIEERIGISEDLYEFLPATVHIGENSSANIAGSWTVEDCSNDELRIRLGNGFNAIADMLIIGSDPMIYTRIYYSENSNEYRGQDGSLLRINGITIGGISTAELEIEIIPPEGTAVTEAASGTVEIRRNDNSVVDVFSDYLSAYIPGIEDYGIRFGTDGSVYLTGADGFQLGIGYYSAENGKMTIMLETEVFRLPLGSMILDFGITVGYDGSSLILLEAGSTPIGIQLS